MTHTQTQGADGAGTKTAATAWLLKRLKAARSDSEAHPEGHSNRTFYAGQAIAYENVLSLLEDEEPTPAPAATPGVPDSLRALSEAATKGEWLYSPGANFDEADVTALVSGCRTEIGNFYPSDGLDDATALPGKANAAFAAAAVNHVRALIAAQPAGQAGVPDSLRKAIAFAAEAEGAPNGRAARRYAGLCCLQWVETLLSPQADKQTEPPALRAVVEVYPDRTDTRLTFGDRIQPEPGVKAVQQAIAALTAEYEARGGCPVVGRHPAGQSTGPGAETDALVDQFSAALKAKLRAAEAKYGWQNGWLQEDWAADCQRDLLRHVSKGDPLDVAAYAAFCWHHGWPTAPNSTRTGAAETGAEEADASVPSHILAMAQAMADGRARAWESMRYGACVPQHHSRSYWVMLAQDAYAALAARPEAPSDAGWRERAATEIDAIAHRWGAEGDADGRAYAKTVAAILRADRTAPPSDPAPSGQAEG